MDKISLPVALRKAKLPGSAPEHPGKTQNGVSQVHTGKRGISLFKGFFSKAFAHPLNIDPALFAAPPYPSCQGLVQPLTTLSPFAILSPAQET